MTNCNRWKLEAQKTFADILTGERFACGEELETDDGKVVYRLTTRGAANILEASHGGKPKCFIFMTLLSNIGGIETFCQNLSRKFGKDIKFVFETADPIQLLMLSRRSDVLMWDGEDIECDTAVYFSVEAHQTFRESVKARTEYQICHADYEQLRKINSHWQFPLPDLPEGHVVGVSEICAKSVQSMYNVSADVHAPVLSSPAKRLVLGAFTRATAEKGIDRLLELCDALTTTGVNWCMFLACNLDRHPDVADAVGQYQQIITLPPTIYSVQMMKACDYVVQLSLTESYCYTVHEALQMGVPVIVRDIPVFNGVVKNGKNGYTLPEGPIDVKRLLQIPKFEAKKEKNDPWWGDLVEGRLK